MTKIPWNKGKYGVQVPWNKGIHAWKNKEHLRGLKGKTQSEYSNKKRSEKCRIWWLFHPEAKEKQRQIILGEKNPNWGGGKPEKYSPEFKKN